MSELVVRLESTAEGLATTYTYEFRSSNPEGTGPLEQEYVVEASPTLVRNLCYQIDKIVKGAPGPTVVDELAKKGGLLWETLFPQSHGNTPDLARRLRDAEGPLLVRTNESLIPWELLHDGDDFLAMTHDLGRRTFVNRPVVDGRTIGVINSALIVGDPLGDLTSAHSEAEQVVAWLRAHDAKCTLLLGQQATLLGVTEELYSGRYDLLHYCGHVAVPVGTTYVGLRLHGDELLDERALQPISAQGVPPIVFINGCASADRLANLCVSFMVMGAKVVVGTRYDVEEVSARRFAEQFYAGLMAGNSAGASIREARQSLRRTSDIDWASFTLYGDPSTRVVTGSEPQPKPPHKEVEHRLDPRASELMERVRRRAAPRGVAISLDLLTELLSTQDFRRRITDFVGAGRLALADELLRSLLDNVPTRGSDIDLEVEYSDTITSVLARAERLAQEGGQDLATVADVVVAFAAVGGGSSGRILDLLGISLADFAAPGPLASPVSEPPSVNGQHGTLFDTDGRLRVDRLTPIVTAAVRVAALLATARGTAISTSALLRGFGITGSEALRVLLAAQGSGGAAALHRLFSSAGTHKDHFSARTCRVLERAAASHATGKVSDAAVLRAILSEDTSSAQELLKRLGVNPSGLPDQIS